MDTDPANDADSDQLTLWLERARSIDDPPESFAGVKLKWFEGLACQRRGRPSEAVRWLDDAFTGLLDHGADVNAATCGLDLAEAHLADGDMDAAVGVAGRLFSARFSASSAASASTSSASCATNAKRKRRCASSSAPPKDDGSTSSRSGTSGGRWRRPGREAANIIANRVSWPPGRWRRRHGPA